MAAREINLRLEERTEKNENRRKRERGEKEKGRRESEISMRHHLEIAENFGSNPVGPARMFKDLVITRSQSLENSDLSAKWSLKIVM